MIQEKDNNNISLTDMALSKIQFGAELINCVEQFENVEGLQKLTRNISREIKFLKKVYKNKLLKKEHLQCSNLTHYSALIDTLKSTKNCESVNKVYALDDRKIVVDIVSDGGLTWTKVIARNPKSVSQICMGNAGYGVRSIIDQAEEYIKCAKLYPCLFRTPNIIFVFTNGITKNIALKLESYGITVKGDRLSSFPEENGYNSDDEHLDTINPSVADLSTKNVSNITKVNVDVSAMLAYCSSVTNGSCHLFDFDVPVLKQQAEWERLRPQKPILDAFFHGKKLYCCQTAKDNFKNIVETVGGPKEKIRAEEFLERLTVLPDDADSKSTSDPSECDELFGKAQFNDDKVLTVGGKIKQRSLTIFTFGDRIHAVTVTANDGFVRAAKQQGINFVVYVHESRALTEQKEETKAIPLVI